LDWQSCLNDLSSAIGSSIEAGLNWDRVILPTSSTHLFLDSFV
jgi:hypothetical protein